MIRTRTLYGVWLREAEGGYVVRTYYTYIVGIYFAGASYYKGNIYIQLLLLITHAVAIATIPHCSCCSIPLLAAAAVVGTNRTIITNGIFLAGQKRPSEPGRASLVLSAFGPSVDDVWFAAGGANREYSMFQVIFFE